MQQASLPWANKHTDELLPKRINPAAPTEVLVVGGERGTRRRRTGQDLVGVKEGRKRERGVWGVCALNEARDGQGFTTAPTSPSAQSDVGRGRLLVGPGFVFLCLCLGT